MATPDERVSVLQVLDNVSIMSFRNHLALSPAGGLVEEFDDMLVGAVETLAACCSPTMATPEMAKCLTHEEQETARAAWGIVEFPNTLRLKIEGGWLYRYDSGMAHPPVLCYVPESARCVEQSADKP